MIDPAKRRKADEERKARNEQRRQERFAQQKAARVALGARIRGLREALEKQEPNMWSQNDVAKLLGIDRANYRRYETGEVAPLPARLDRLAELLDTTVDYLIGKTDQAARITLDTLSEDEMKLIGAFRRRDLKALNRLFHKKAREDEGE